MTEASQVLPGIWPHVITPVVFLSLFTLPPFPLRRLLFIVAFVSLFRLCFSPFSVPLGGDQVRVVLPLLWMFYLGWLAKMVLHNPEHDFWRIGRPAHEAERMPFGREKLLWALSLLTSPRGVGWNFQLKNLEPRQHSVGQGRFMPQQVLRVVEYTGISRLLATALRSQCVVSGWKVLAVPGIAAKYWADAETLCAARNVALVAFGLAREQDCLPLFGSNIASLDSLQEFWGQFWHQTYRKMFEDFGCTVARILGVRPHTELWGIVLVWTAFAISGAAHGFALSIAPGDEGAYARLVAVLGFFILQAVGLTIESLFLITPARDLTLYEIGLKDEKILGRIWTFGWLLLSGYWAVNSWFDTNWTSLSMFVAMTPLVKRSWRPSRA